MKEIIREGHRLEGRWIIAPLSDISVPKIGRICYPNKWWRVTENKEVLFFDYYSSPQCNDNKSIVDRLACGFDAPPTTSMFLENAFLPQSGVS